MSVSFETSVVDLKGPRSQQLNMMGERCNFHNILIIKEGKVLFDTADLIDAKTLLDDWYAGTAAQRNNPTGSRSP
jgi:hypothetical protein